MIFLRPTRYIEEEDAPLPVTDTTPGSGMCRITPLTLACSALTPGQLRAGRDKAIRGPKRRARRWRTQPGKAAMAVEVLNRMIRIAKPRSVRIA